MKRVTSRCGFTLVEMMLVVAISIIMFAALASSFIGGIRLLRVTFATSEMSLQARMLRDRLLFRATPPQNNAVWAGLLSGTNATDVLEGNATKILMHCQALKNSNGETAPQTIQLIFKDYGTKKCSFFNEDRHDETWLHPGGIDLLADSAATAPLVWARKADNTEDHSRFYIRLTGRMDVTGLPVKHDERIVVPVFGCLQETRLDRTGGLDK